MGEVLLRLALLRQGVLTREQLVALEVELAERAEAATARREDDHRDDQVVIPAEGG